MDEIEFVLQIVVRCGIQLGFMQLFKYSSPFFCSVSKPFLLVIVGFGEMILASLLEVSNKFVPHEVGRSFISKMLPVGLFAFARFFESLNKVTSANAPFEGVRYFVHVPREKVGGRLGSEGILDFYRNGPVISWDGVGNDLEHFDWST